MITFQKLSAKHYRVDEFNYRHFLKKLSDSVDFFEKPIMFAEKNIPPALRQHYSGFYNK